MNEEHEHNWKTTDKPNMLMCTVPNCNTASTLKDAFLINAEHAKVKVLAIQLRHGDLKKSAKDEAYAFVKSKGQNITVYEQESFI